MAAMAAAVCLGGCGAVETLYSGKGEKEYGKAETMVILTTERLRYENVYSEEIWTAEVDGGGTAFETVLTGQIHDFLKELKVMSLMAREKEITLSSREKELAKTAGRPVYGRSGLCPGRGVRADRGKSGGLVYGLLDGGKAGGDHYRGYEPGGQRQRGQGDLRGPDPGFRQDPGRRDPFKDPGGGNGFFCRSQGIFRGSGDKKTALVRPHGRGV